MASQPMQVWRQGNPRVPKGREIAGADADLNSIVDVQLVAKTNRLSISEAGTAAETPTGEANGLRPLNMASVETLCPPGFDNQQYVATKGEWQDNILAASPVATTVAVTSDAPQPLEATAASRTQLAENFNAVRMTAAVPQRKTQRQLLDLPNEVLFHILSYLETSHHLRALSLNPHLHQARLRRTRALLPPLLTSPSRPSRTELVRRSIVLTHTTFASRRLARSLASIRLARQLAKRPSAETLVERCVLPPECLPLSPSPSPSLSSSSVGNANGKRRRNGSYAGVAPVAPALVARKRAVERERVKDGLRAWVGSVWKGEVGKREERVRRWEERAGVGRVWRLRQYWERVGRGEEV
ncbi:hypothetical protein P885DRAFT_79923 [Corynascus similis CBS 632.67]